MRYSRKPTGTVTLSVTTTAMPPGSYPATVTVTATGAQGSPKTIGVTLELSSTVLAVSPPNLSFSGPVGGAAPPAQSLSVTNSASSSVLAFTATSNKSWLSVAPGSGNTPNSLSVSVNPAGLPAGTQTGQRFRLRKRGVPRADGGRGDLYVEVEVVIPAVTDTRSKELLREFERLQGDAARPAARRA